MGSTRFEIEFFSVIGPSTGPWRAKACLENIHEFGKNADDGNKRGELHTDQPPKFAIDFWFCSAKTSKMVTRFSMYVLKRNALTWP
ncbi:MAG: hypothetical protein CK528_14320 [Alcaligenaceae bacterium]|nr:MAG: hypothetical protein CK528_14320 [Alcaligenaceae bacterium]